MTFYDRLFAKVDQLTAPRSAQSAIGDATVSVRAEQTGVPSVTPAPSLSAARLVESVGGTPTPEGEIGTAIEGGILAYAAPSLGDRYLAIPEGPGHRVRVCAEGRCLDRTSTDAGPALFLQRQGRIGDISFVDFRFLCQCRPEDVGLLRGSIERAGPRATLPATDTP